jgi:hypothetical protein
VGWAMSELLNKISSYNIFNYLLPGILFAFLAQHVLPLPMPHTDVLVGAFLYYFLGMVVSRFGSLVLEPLLKVISFVRYADYKDFVAAEKKDQKLQLLLEINNTYRTLCSSFILILLLKLYIEVEGKYPVLKAWDVTIGMILLAIMFLFSYRKQTSYVKKRVREVLAADQERSE